MKEHVTKEPTVDVIIVGASGRLGRLVLEAVLASSGFRVRGAVVRNVGNAQDLPGGTHCVDDLKALLGTSNTTPLVVIDVATAGATARHASLCAEAGAAYVCATTGLSSSDQAALSAASTSTAVLVAANLSPGAHLVGMFAEQAARILGDGDVEIVEVHHRHKKDAPSGTALMLAECVAAGRAAAGQEAGRQVHARDGHAPRQPGDIGVVAVRGGDVVGEHTVSFYGDGERVELVHKVSDRRIFARGAVLAARFLATASSGQHSMRDVLHALR